MSLDPPGPQRRTVTVEFDLRNARRLAWSLVAVVALVSFGAFVLQDGGTVLFTLIMSWFASLAMEPAVRRLSQRMPRGAATGVTMGAVAVFLAVFLYAFGQLFVEQVAELVTSLPGVVTGVIDWVNQRFDTAYSVNDAIASLNLTPANVQEYAGQVLGGVLGLFGSVLGAFFSSFTFLLFTFYLSAGGPSLRRWIARRLPVGQQQFFIDAWDLTTLKTGGYVAARVTLAAVNAATTAVVFIVIGMPSWLALALWTGLVAQFVPTIGTYISIVLPVVVGLLSPNPLVGVIALAWALVYQQIENLTLEPRISARAVDVHPAVAFASVMFGAALFGPSGALIAVPVAAMLLALFELRGTVYGYVPGLGDEAADPVPDEAAPAG